ncbi:MAG TPA: ThiF family adenylyltransferase, partial [Planctomycetota bacterium]|nr:ThiF family adenylyltransferase [Planctomycetota bacterium]
LGAGHLYIIDYDTIEPTNLTRSVLYRDSDAGKSKAERAAAAVQSINPEVQVHAVNGNVITDLGLGVFSEMDVVIGCLDNREARLWINRQCWKVNRPWVDGAIQEISGVVKVFVPPDSACYECGMTERDYQLINLKYSCPLLRREDIAQGKIPTAPTIASMIAGLQTQEALKLLHGMAVKPGAALVWNGESNSCYTTAYQRKENCLSHETYGEPVPLPLGVRDSVETLLGASEGRRLVLDRDLLVSVECPACKVKRELYRPVGLVSMKEGTCGSCGAVMKTEIVHVVEQGTPLSARSLRDVGVAPYDIVKVQTEQSGMYVRLDRDRADEMEWK